MCGLYANTMPFYMGDLSGHRFGYPWGVFKPIPERLLSIISSLSPKAEGRISQLLPSFPPFSL
jgi:hypothetical protein